MMSAFESCTIQTHQLFRVIDRRLQIFVKRSINEFMKFSNQKFNGPMPIGLDRTHLKTVRASSRYFATPKADGIRVLCYAFEYYIDKVWHKMVALLNRSGEVFVVPNCMLANKRYAGTIFDAELLDIGLLMFDSYAIDGISLIHEPLKSRLCHAQHILDDLRMPFSLRLKPYVCLNSDYDMDTLDVDFATDGLVIVSAGAVGEQFKWKSTPTVDLEVVVIEDGGMALSSVERILQPIDETEIAHLHFEYGSKKIVECRIELPLRYIPWSVRSDKTMANCDHTVQSTTKCVEEAIQMCELFTLPKRRVKR